MCLTGKCANTAPIRGGLILYGCWNLTKLSLAYADTLNGDRGFRNGDSDSHTHRNIDYQLLNNRAQSLSRISQTIQPIKLSCDVFVVAESVGLEPTRAEARQFSRLLPYQLG